MNGMSWRFRATIALGCPLLLVACSKPAAPVAQTLTPVTLQADWFAEAEQAGNYQALARGFYRQAGLDVTIRNGGPGCFPLQKVATGRADFALGRSDDVLMAVANAHLPLVILCAYMEKDPMSVFVHASSPVKDFPDLAGRVVMADTSSAWIPYLKARYHMSFGVIPLNYSLTQFMAEPWLIVQGFATSEPYFLRLHGIASRTLLIANSGYNPYRVIFANRSFVRQHPDATRAFVAATLEGWNDFLGGDREPAERLIRAVNPEMTPGYLAYSIKAMQADHMLRGDPALGERIGLITRGRLQQEVDLAVKLKLIPAPIPVDEFATFDYLPPDLASVASR